MNALYDKGREGFLGGDISWRDDEIRVLLVDTDLYTPNLATDKFLSAIPLGARIAVSAPLIGKDITDGIADADDVLWDDVVGPVSEAIVIVQWTGVDATARLIAYIDQATGLPVTPDGDDIVLQWIDGPNKIFKL